MENKLSSIPSPNTFEMLLVMILFGMSLLWVMPWGHSLILRCAQLAVKVYNNYSRIKYEQFPLTPITKHRLQLVKRKTLILDMDESLIKAVAKQKNDLGSVHYSYDHSFVLEEWGTRIFVYKRPHVDYFLELVSEWYDVFIFTSATEAYAKPVLDCLDNGRGLLRNRRYRQHCRNINGIYCKFVSCINNDMANVILVDNLKIVCENNFGNSIHIKSYEIGTKDEELLKLLPFLDCLRFTSDVRNVLQRCW